MDIINIITAENNIVKDIKSYIVNPDSDEEIIKQAEKAFTEIIRNFSKPETVEDEDIEVYIEDGFFEYKGITVNFVWSTSREITCDKELLKHEVINQLEADFESEDYEAMDEMLQTLIDEGKSDILYNYLSDTGQENLKDGLITKRY